MLPLDMLPLDMDPLVFFFLAIILSLLDMDALSLVPLFDIAPLVDMDALLDVDMPAPAEAWASATPEIPTERPIASTVAFAK